MPAVAERVDITVSALHDSLTEGPEDTVLELAPSEFYAVGSGSAASVRIDDVQSTKSCVSLAVLAANARETGAQAKIRVSRTGAVDGPFEAQLRIAGSATPGVDIYQIPPSVNFATGFPFVDIDVTAIDDAAAESNETILFSVVPSVNYDSGLHMPDGSLGTVPLIDDDASVVSVRASLGSVSEGDSRGGAFLVSRTGDVAQPLVVYYSLDGTALHGTGYHPLSGLVTIPAGATAAAVPIIPVADTWGEPTQTETLFTRARDDYRVGTSNSASIALTNSGNLPYVSVSAIAGALDPGEAYQKLPNGNSVYGPGNFRIACFGGTGSVRVDYPVSGSAVSGKDFTPLPGSVTVPANGSVDDRREVDRRLVRRTGGVDQYRALQSGGR